MSFVCLPHFILFTLVGQQVASGSQRPMVQMMFISPCESVGFFQIFKVSSYLINTNTGFVTLLTCDELGSHAGCIPSPNVQQP